MDAQNISAKYTPRPAHKVIEQYMCAVVSVILKQLCTNVITNNNNHVYVPIVVWSFSKTKIRKKEKVLQDSYWTKKKPIHA